MPESREHRRLKEEAIEQLRRMGFHDDEIFLEYRTVEGIRVDVVGISPERRVAIECGDTYKGARHRILERSFDTVIYKPYTTPRRNVDYGRIQRYEEIEKMSLQELVEEKERRLKTVMCSFRLPRTLLHKMEKYCRETGATHSGLARVAIEKFLEDQKWKRERL